MSRATKILSVVALLAILGAGIAIWKTTLVSAADSHRLIRLQNRTIELSTVGETSVEPADLPRLTARGTRIMLVQMRADATVSTRRAVEECGARILGVIPPHGFSVEVDDAAARRLSESPAVFATVPESVFDKLAKSLPLNTQDVQTLTVVPLAETDVAAVRAQVAAVGGEVFEEAREPSVLRIRLKGTSIVELAKNGEVRWIERFVRPRPVNDVAVSEGHLNVQPVWNSYGLAGKGQYITTSDTGIDTGDLATIHPDFRTNLVGFDKSQWDMSAIDRSGHGTHTAASIVGDGTASEGRFKGVAYESKLWAWFCGGDGGIYPPADTSELFRPSALTAGTAYIHSASWGGNTNCYNSTSQAYDQYLWEHPDFLAVFAAGNNWKANTIHSEAGAKNTLAVGATATVRPELGWPTNSNNYVADYSSKGPMPDGRIKPDLVSPGTLIVSARSTQATTESYNVYDDNYRYMSGTSMACPLAAGAAALVRQWLVERRGFTNEVPSAALLKAVLTGGADELYGRQYANVPSVAPNSTEGWGRINLGEALYPTNRTVVLIDRVPFAESHVQEYAFSVSEAGPLNIQLVWTDYPGDPKAAQALVNDLDLVLSNKTTAAVWFGNGITGGDHTNNVESIRLAQAEAGNYAVLVRGTRVAYDYQSGGAAALYLRGKLETEEPQPEEKVKLTVSVTGGVGQMDCSPPVGEHEYTKGMSVKLTAEGYSYAMSAASSDLPISRAPFVGFAGTGSVPASGCTNEIVVTLQENSSVTWDWSTTVSDHRLRTFVYNYGEYSDCYDYYIFDDGHSCYTQVDDRWLPVDAKHVFRPTDLSFGDRYEYRGWIYCYDLWDRQRKWYGVIDMRLGSLVLAECGDMEASGYQYDDRGRMPVPLTVTMDRPLDLYAVYYNVEDVFTGYPPYWWCMRYLCGVEAGEATLTGDPDADGFNNEAEYAEQTDPVDDASFPFKMREFSLTNLVFTGSVKGLLILERQEQLGGEWVGIWTNSSERTSVSNSVDMSVWASSNGFYRVIYKP